MASPAPLNERVDGRVGPHAIVYEVRELRKVVKAIGIVDELVDDAKRLVVGGEPLFHRDGQRQP